MKKTLTICSLVVALFLTGCSSTINSKNNFANSVQSQSDFKSKTLQEKRTENIENISIDIPSDWKKEVNNNNFYYYTSEDDFLMVQTPEFKYELNDFSFDTILDSSTSSMSNINITNKGFSVINSQKFFTATYTATYSNSDLLAEIYATKVDSKLYIFAMTCKHQDSKHIDIVPEIINSFKTI